MEVDAVNTSALLKRILKNCFSGLDAKIWKK